MVAIPFPLSSSPGEHPHEGAGRLVNCFAEALGEGARAKVRWRRVAGLRRLVEIAGHSHCRGFKTVSSGVLVVLDSRVYFVAGSGETFVATNLGALSGDGPVTIAVNNASTPNIACVTEDGAFNLYTVSAPDAFADTDLPVPNSVEMLNGYFLFTIGDGRIFASDLNSVSINSLSFTTEQGLSLRRGRVFNGEFFAFGDKWIGVYNDVATSPFPLARKFSIGKGLVGTHALAGPAAGWANEMAWVSTDNRVYRMDGYTPAPISNVDVERVIAETEDRSQIVCDVYQHNGHSIWTMTNPGAWTWEYNFNTQNWHERKSYGSEFWRGSRTVYAFDRWLAGDHATGLLFSIDPNYAREENNPLVFDLTSGPVANFPARIGSPRADFDLTAAVGLSSGLDPIQTDPSVLISISNDGGYSWSSQIKRAIGKQGEAKRAVTVNRTGLARAKGKRFRLQISDPVEVSFMGGQLDADVRGA